MECALDHDGAPIRAEPGPPWDAVCPYCAGLMVLRCRRRSRRAGDVIYFWRHADNTSLECPARRSPGSERMIETASRR
jgi:hypothetical protein